MGRILGAALLVAGLSFLASPAVAQRLELGGSVGFGKPGSEGSLIGRGGGSVNGLHASFWWDDRVEIGFRAVWRDLPARTRPTIYYAGCGAGATPDCQRREVGVFFRPDDPRRFTAMEFLYHPARGARLRPFFGAGFGSINTSETWECEVDGCQAFLQFRLGRHRASAADIIGIVGASRVVADHLLFRGALHFHRPGGEDLSLFELALMVGYRF